MAEKLFPERQRCKKCGKGLGLKSTDPVYLGLYCTPRCAGMAVPASRPDDDRTPRGCRTMRDGAWQFKKRYRSEQEIPDRLREDPSTSWYWCTESCGHLHVGRTLVETKRAENRGLRDRAAIADMLVKARGHATHKQVGEAIKSRPIRVKEWEDASFDAPSIEVLFKLLAVYRIDLTAVFRTR